MFLSQLQYGAAGTTERIHSALIKCGNERYMEMPWYQLIVPVVFGVDQILCTWLEMESMLSIIFRDNRL